MKQILNGKSPKPGFKLQFDEEVQALAPYTKALQAN
jgi:hypothetical protein